VDEACDITVYFNPTCSKCRGARDLLADADDDVRYVEYLQTRPDRAELERLMRLLGIDDPREMTRTGEAVYKELGLADATADELLDAIAAHPILLERPIVVRGDRAVIARPPERLLELL
jgi:arsenate reductase